jgi:hypothetical protein
MWRKKGKSRFVGGTIANHFSSDITNPGGWITLHFGSENGTSFPFSFFPLPKMMDRSEPFFQDTGIGSADPAEGIQRNSWSGYRYSGRRGILSRSSVGWR